MRGALVVCRRNDRGRRHYATVRSTSRMIRCTSKRGGWSTRKDARATLGISDLDQP